MDAARLFFACSITFLLGAAMGAFATRTLYGDIEPVEPVTRSGPACPPCPDCPVCAPSEASMPGTFEPASDELDLAMERLESAEPTESGLALTAIRSADAAVQEAVQPCLRDGRARGVGGSVVLDLRVRVDGGTGTIRDAVALSQGQVDAEAEACLVEAARQARFEVDGPDGAGRLKVAVRFDP